MLVVKSADRTSEAYHEVAFCELELVRQALLRRVRCGTLNLVVVVVESDHVNTREFDNFTGRSSHTAAHVQDTHVVLEVHLVGQVVLVAGNGLVEGLAECITAKVETLAPTVLVQVGCKVIVVSG